MIPLHSLPRLILTAWTLLPATAFAADVRSLCITNADGLSNSSVTTILEDSHHTVWLGTWDGLNAFNGRDMRTYKYDPSDENSLSNNVIREIIEQRPGTVWVATDNGVNRLDLLNDRISRFHFGYDSANPLPEHSFLLARTGDGTLFCAVRQYGLAYYEEAEQRFVALNLPGIDLFEIDGMLAAGNRLWLLDASGRLHAIPVGRDRNGKIVLGAAAEASGAHGRYRALYDGAGSHLIAAEADSICLLDPQSGACVRRIVRHAAPGCGDLTAVAESDSTLLAAFSLGGVYRYSPAGERWTAVEFLQGKAVLALRRCSQQTLWAGTDGEGVVVQYPRHRNFGVVYNRQMQGRRNSPVRCFCTGPDGVLWVGTKGDGIFRFGDRFEPLPARSRITTADGLSNNSVYCLIEGLRGDLLAGTDGQGVDVCSGDGERTAPLDISLLTRNGDTFGSVYSLYLDRDRKILWAGTSGFGLVRMHLETTSRGYRVTEYRKYLYDPEERFSIGNNTIYAILPAADGRSLWIGTRGGGLNRLDPAEERFTCYPHHISDPATPSSNDILSLATDRNGTLWVGTGYGLNRMEPDGSFTRFTEQDGLPDNTIHGILPDGQGAVWVSTNRGVSRLHPGTGRTVNYTMDDELQNNEFSDGAAYRAPDGTFYLGGISGFNHFVPDRIRERSFSPRIGITDFRIFNERIPGYNDYYFRKPGNGVVLDHDQRFFSIGFVASDLVDNRNCEYAYRLEGFDRDWVTATRQGTAVFTNVPPGRYTFRVRSTNSDKIWCDNEFSFPLLIRHPWWARWWAFGLYALLGTLIGYIVYRIVRNHLSLNKALFLERLSQQRQQEIHEAKLRFFTNIAHEFCTPLTLIYSPCEKLLEEGGLDDNSAKYVRIIRSNAARMQGLISELMDFRKVETGHRVLHFERIDLHELVCCVADNFAELNRENGIDFSLDFPSDHPIAVSDRDCLEKIVFNLISNAYKYTPLGGSISVGIRSEAADTILTVTNTGKGIRPEELETVFDRFKMLDNFERQVSRGNVVRTGIGLALTKGLVTLLGGTIRVESEVGRRTVFTVCLPEAAPSETSETSEADEQPPEPAPLPEGTRTLLIVDDEAEIRDLVADLFRDRYAVLQAADGRQAIEVMKRQRPDVILCDIIMPAMNGPELVKELKSNPFTASIPIVFLTSKVSLADHISGYDLGVEAYIPKPFHPRHLQSVVNRLISSRESLRDYYNSPLAQTDLYNGSYLPEKDKNFLVQLNRTIEENLENESLDLAHIASTLAVSRMQLYRRIKELTGSSPSEYIRCVKLNRAAHLLRTTELTVQEIMYRSGFNNKSYFYREFTQKFASSPKEYRNKTTEG
ncbi:two-component regulator propeller domain-containing protein [Alistipes sp.]|uniref:two-component regulator propeller domain-containing protein n=1 Tax=Alistipes sp. TaxID=1872444 RepID=UPI003AEFAEC6